MSYTYRFSFQVQYTADDPATPVSGLANVEMVFVADTLDDAKAQFANALDTSLSTADQVNVTGIIVLP